MIYCVWYPSGGFGHFINGILSLYGQNFARPNNKNLEFSANGNSHALDLVVPKYKNTRTFNFDFDPTTNYSVLIDNGINDETTDWIQNFPTASVIKITYSVRSWPIVARTMIEKAMKSSLKKELSGECNFTESWQLREKYFLFLREHALAHAWKPNSNYINVSVDDFLSYNTLKLSLSRADIDLEDFFHVWQTWYTANQTYINPVIYALDIIDCLKNGINKPLDHVNDTWLQAVLYYFIFLEFNKEIPHNDYENFFCNTDQIVKWLKK